MTYVMRLLGIGTGVLFPIPQYLQTFDIEAHDGRGDASATYDPVEAHQFASWQEAMDTWNTQSVLRPLRDDGKPNKPLCAFTIEITTLEQALEDLLLE